ncbi:GntR family transcriptional regulator [Paenibacillus cellulosilyticus]|uniref:GntR family transcriptional regulator n=1 Tax=Paenibacillus cellulosilyticus TaxID=375489 RepID=A0A2V2YUD7_9BACL|nr:FadR/GntR family transcriptional regulator [Paenibacillus cellulosilyticus]PWW02877.1 GntR family transcriptional regulator [Paenibacillus cellulosilyticus]QKS45790.1 FadR family transcriptional regulator [Paenibacillus cellulosilyticus]
MLQKPNRLTLVEQVTKQLEQLIEQGVWKPGTKIPPEPELMDQLEVSRNTLREAIKALMHAGMLQTKQGDGTYVRAASAFGPALQRRVRKTDALQTFEVRRALEREAAILAARRRTDEEAERLRHCFNQCSIALDNNDNDAYAEWDMQFHRAVVEASHNELLIEMYSHIADAMQEIIKSVAPISDQQTITALHLQLLQAIEQQEERAAEQAVHAYIHLSQSHI